LSGTFTVLGNSDVVALHSEIAQRGTTALKLMRKLLKTQGFAPTAVVTDKLPSYRAGEAITGQRTLTCRFGSENDACNASSQPVQPRGGRELRDGIFIESA